MFHRTMFTVTPHPPKIKQEEREESEFCFFEKELLPFLPFSCLLLRGGMQRDGERCGYLELDHNARITR